MFVLAATLSLLLRHAAFAAGFVGSIMKIYTRKLPHTIMHIHSNAGGHSHVHKSYKGEQEFFHDIKVFNYIKAVLLK